MYLSIGFCALNILSKFGTLSGLSSAPFDLSILKLMSEVDKSGSDLRGDSQTKAKWILNMVINANAFHFSRPYLIVARVDVLNRLGQ
jgi:hypothetical protein